MAVLKKEFVDRMAETGGITKKEARRGFDLFIETLMDCMCKNEKVMITGIGRFEMKTAKERKTRMPLGGEYFVMPEHRRMKFYPSRLLSGRIDDMGKLSINDLPKTSPKWCPLRCKNDNNIDSDLIKMESDIRLTDKEGNPIEVKVPEPEYIPEVFFTKSRR